MRRMRFAGSVSLRPSLSALHAQKYATRLELFVWWVTFPVCAEIIEMRVFWQSYRNAGVIAHSIPALAFPARFIGVAGEVSIGRNGYGDTGIILGNVAAFTLPACLCRAEKSVGRHFDDCTGIVGPSVAAFAFPAAAKRIQIGIGRDRDRHAGGFDLLETPDAIPTRSI